MTEQEDQKKNSTPALENIEIHTMQEDLAAARLEAETPPLKINLSSGSQIFDLHHPLTPQTETAKIIPPAVNTTPGAPNQQAHRSIRTLSLPATKPRPTKPVTWALASIVVALVVSGITGGALYLRTTVFQPAEKTVSTEVARVIPAQAQLVIQYSLTSTQQRDHIRDVWQQVRPSPPSLENLLAGDPRFLLDDPDLTELNYVLLARDSTPYLVVPQTDFTREQLFPDVTSANAVEVGGWYIAHATDKELYVKALSNGTMAATAADQLLSRSQQAMRLLLKTSYLSELRQQLFGSGLVDGQAQNVLLETELFNPEAPQSITGLASLSSPLTNIPANHQLLTKVPGDASAVHIGGNFPEDAAQLMLLNNIKLPATAVKAITNLLSQLDSSSYAYYLRPGAAADTDVGLIIELSPSLQNSLILGNEDLEAALPALLALVFGIDQPNALHFSDAVYSEIPLRYNNLPNSTQSLDYAIIDNNLLITTSQVGIEQVIDTATGQAPNLSASSNMTTLLNAWGALPDARDIIIAAVSDPALLLLLPTSNDASQLLLGLAVQPGGKHEAFLQGTMLLNSGQ